MDVSRLKAATLEEHRAVEDSLPLMRPDLSRDGYVAVLKRLYGLIAAWEILADQRFAGTLREVALSRHRLPLLRDDLQFFGISPDQRAQPQIAIFDGIAELLGAMYVMEGSRLGGQLIARHVSKVLRLEDSRGCSFFNGSGATTGEQWKNFLEILRTQIDDCDSDRAILGAKKMFRTFGNWMKGAHMSCESEPIKSDQ